MSDFYIPIIPEGQPETVTFTVPSADADGSVFLTYANFNAAGAQTLKITDGEKFGQLKKIYAFGTSSSAKIEFYSEKNNSNDRVAFDLSNVSGMVFDFMWVKGEGSEDKGYWAILNKGVSEDGSQIGTIS